MDGPLSFWLAVENMRAAKNTKVRQLRAQNITKRFFCNPQKPAELYLNCDADIIRYDQLKTPVKWFKDGMHQGALEKILVQNTG